MSTNPSAISAGGGLALQATTGIGGFAKQNGTPNILTWTAPNDGQPHRWLVYSTEVVTVAETGGAISTSWTGPGGGAQAPAGNIYTGSKAIGNYHSTDAALAAPGTTVTVLQSTALTLGTSTVWVELWAS